MSFFVQLDPVFDFLAGVFERDVLLADLHHVIKQHFLVDLLGGEETIRLADLVEEYASISQQVRRHFQLVLYVPSVANLYALACFRGTDGGCQRVVADHPDGREHADEVELAVVAQRKQQVLLDDIVTDDGDAALFHFC